LTSEISEILDQRYLGDILGLTGTAMQVFKKTNGERIIEHREHNPKYWTTDFKMFSKLQRAEIYTVNHFFFNTPENAADFYGRIENSIGAARNYPYNRGEDGMNEPINLVQRGQTCATSVIILYGKKMNKAIIYLVLLVLLSCTIKRGEDDMSEPKTIPNPLMVKVLPYFSYPEITDEERWRLKDLFDAVHRLRAEKVVEYLSQPDYDPDQCLGVEGWISTNPLNVLIRTFYNTYSRMKRNETIPTLVPDIAVFNALMEGGADINRFPYIWLRVYNWGTFYTDPIQKKTITQFDGKFNATQEEADEEIRYFIEDASRLIRALLEAGADPDKLGHPYPFGRQVAEKDYFSDEEANEYFARGTRPINEAIKKGIVWESQVDLLLHYTKLDEASLEAAQESGDPVMIEKINKLWQEQNGTR
jgi:hypothetical protein